MTTELIIIIVALASLVALYWARWNRTDHSSLLFPHKFLHRMDEFIFDFVKFAFKLYALLVGNVKSFFKAMPHKVAHGIHKATHTAATKSKTWVDGAQRPEDDGTK